MLSSFSVEHNGIPIGGIINRHTDGVIDEESITLFNPDSSSKIRAIGFMVHRITPEMQRLARQASGDSTFSVVEITNALPERWKGVLRGTAAHMDMQHLGYLGYDIPDQIRRHLQVRPEQLQSKKIIDHVGADMALEQLNRRLADYSQSDKLSHGLRTRDAFIDFIDSIFRSLSAGKGFSMRLLEDSKKQLPFEGPG